MAQTKAGTVPAAAKQPPEKLTPEQRVRRALVQATDLQLKETPLDEVVNLIKEHHKIEVQIDKKALDDVGIATDTLVTKSLKGISLRSALRIILHELDLTYMVENEVLLITTPEVADMRLTTTVYDVADLVAGDEKSGEQTGFESLIGVLTTGVRPWTWDSAGGFGAVSRFDGGGIRALVVSQTQESHEEVVGLLSMLRDICHAPPGKRAAGRIVPEPGAAHKAILRALQQATEVEFFEKPLDQVVNVLKEKHKIEIQLDKRALDDVGIATDTLVTKSLKGISLRSALRLMLNEPDLTYMVRDEVLLITTPEVADVHLETRLYDVTDLVEGKAADAYVERLIDAITNCVRPMAWDAAGGPGAICPFHNGGTHVLVVGSTQEVHEEVADLLAQLRQLRRGRPAETAPAVAKPAAKPVAVPDEPPIAVKPPAEMLPKLTPAEQIIAAALDKPVSLHFKDTPLDEVVADLNKKTGLSILLDKKAIDAGPAELTFGGGGFGAWGDKTPPKPKPREPRPPRRVTLQVADVKLRSALKLLLDPVDLGWTVREGRLLITSCTVADQNVLTRTYDVSDLPAFRDEQGRVVPDYSMLIGAITAAVDDTSWDVAGGPGTIRPADLNGVQAVVVAKTWQNHEDIASLLTELRKNRKRPLTKAEIEKLPPAPPPEEKEAAGKPDPDDKLPAVALRPLPADAKRDAVVAWNTELACDLYAKLREGSKDDIFFSPYSISTALGMTYAGTRGETAREMAAALHFPLGQDDLHPAAGNPLAATPRAGDQPGCRLKAANRLWMQQGYKFHDEFLATARQSYSAEPAMVDFRDPQLTARAINRWVEEQTNRRIKDVVSADALDPDMRLILTNAVHFKGKWHSPFEKSETRPMRFYPHNRESVWVQMMRQTETFGYAASDGLEILEMPYRGKHVSMLILLPARGTGGLGDLERQLTAQNLRNWTAGLKEQEVEVYVPRFKGETTMPLARTLKSLGMKRAFDPRPGAADFSGMADTREIYLSDVLQKAYIEVDETGTEAAAATFLGAMGGMAGPPPPRPPVFRADHPFVYLIRDNRTGTILFLGRLMSPPGVALAPAAGLGEK